MEPHIARMKLITGMNSSAADLLGALDSAGVKIAPRTRTRATAKLRGPRTLGSAGVEGNKSEAVAEIAGITGAILNAVTERHPEIMAEVVAEIAKGEIAKAEIISPPVELVTFRVVEFFRDGQMEFPAGHTFKANPEDFADAIQRGCIVAVDPEAEHAAHRAALAQGRQFVGDAPAPIEFVATSTFTNDGTTYHAGRAYHLQPEAFTAEIAAGRLIAANPNQRTEIAEAPEPGKRRRAS